MIDKDKIKYTVQKIDDEPEKAEEKPEEMPEIPPMPMVEISTSSAMIAFFIIICAAAFCTFMVHRIIAATSIAMMIGCTVMLIILVCALAGIFGMTIGKFRRGSKLRLVFVLAIYIIAVVIGIYAGSLMPLPTA